MDTKDSKDSKPWLFKPGQSGNPGGRPKGTKNILSRDSVRRLGELGMDPIEELTGMYHAALAQGNDELAFKVLNKLVEYGYSKTPVMSETKHEGAIPVLSVTTKGLTDEDDES